MKLVKVWDRVVAYINDPKTQDDAVKIMSARVGLTPAAYKPLLEGTHLLDLAEGKKIYKKGKGLDFALWLFQNRRRFQREKRGLQAGAGHRHLYRSVADRRREMTSALRVTGA